MQQKTVSTMQPLTGTAAGAAASLIISRLSVPIIQRIDGYMNGVDTSTQYWLMFFAGTTVPANATQPLFALQVVGKNGFSWDFGSQGGLDFTKMSTLFAGTLGLVVAISSTASTLTASAATMDIAVTINEPFLPVKGLSVAGDLTTAVAALSVFANNQTVRKAIYHIDATNTDAGTAQYLQLFPNGIPIANQVPQWSSPAIADGASYYADFGSDGYAAFQQTAANPPLVLNGCYLAVSTDPTKYVAPSGTHWTIRAFYK